MTPDFDRLAFAPPGVDLTRSPLAGTMGRETFILGAFNPGLTRLPNGKLLLMVRVAEALRQPIEGNLIYSIRWDPRQGFVADGHALATVDASDPRTFRLLAHPSRVMALTSLSWLLPVVISADGARVEKVHYDKAIIPQTTFQQYGVEDARISRVDGRYYMTTCSVSAERQSTTLYTSDDGLDYRLQGIILDHQNKDMLIFEGKIAGKFHALTRPLGDLYFAYPPDSPYEPGPAILLSSSPDALHWKPADTPLIRSRKGSTSVLKLGGGSPPVRTSRGWLMLYHGVQPGTVAGVYRTFWALLDLEDPSRILEVHDEDPLLESRPELTEGIKDLRYLSDVVFTTGIVDDGDHYLVASGEDDLACRLTRLSKSIFA